MNTTETLLAEFLRIKKLGFLKSTRPHNTGIGKTFEDYLNINENNIPEADFLNFEIKSQRFLTKSKITLFTKSPSNPNKANFYLRENYGTTDKNHELKVLHTSFYANRFNTYKNKFGFKIKVNKKSKKVYILVKNLSNDSIIDENIFYTFSDLKKSTNKLKNLMIVTADIKTKNNIEYFHFTNAKIFTEFNFDAFINLIKTGIIQYDIRIGYYKSGKNYGKTHDHGSGFRISRDKFHLLYNSFYDID